MTAQGWWIAAAASACLTVIAGIADWARARRRNLDNPGWMPWRLVLVVSLFATFVFGVLASTGRFDLGTGYQVPRPRGPF